MSQSGSFSKTGVIPPGTYVETLTGNSGGAVGPDLLGNIDTLGSGSITIVGNPGTNTLTTQLTGITQHSLQVGGAGGNNLTQLGVATNGQLPIGSTGADPVLATITQGTGITVTNGAGTITIATAGSVPLSFPADTGTGTPAGGILDIFGDSHNVTTTGSGHQVVVGLTGITQHSVQVGGASNALTQLTAGTNGQVLLGSTGADPSFITPTAGTGLSITTNASTLSYALSTPVSIANGGTNATSMTDTDGVVYYDGTRLVTTTVGTSGQILTSNGAAVAPTFQNASSVSRISITGNTGGALVSNAFTFSGGTTGLSFGGSGTTETLTITDLNLPDTTSSTQGAININGVRVLHCYGGVADGNIFVGESAGNFTLTPGVAQDNAALGINALRGLTTGVVNSAVGVNSLISLTTGQRNSMLGGSTFDTIISGNYNVGVGDQSGANYVGAESHNICINATSTTVAAESNVLRIGNGTGTGQQQLAKAFISGIAGVNVGSVATVVTESANQLGTAVITAGTGISVTPSANAITIAASVITINGDTGSATGPTFTLTSPTATSGTPKFVASGSTVTFTAEDANNNVIFGSNSILPSSGAGNVGLGHQAFGALGNATSASLNSAFGYQGMFSITSGSHNASFGQQGLLFITTGSYNLNASGYQGGLNYTSSESSNITINCSTTTVTGESNVLRIGDGTGTGIQQLNKAFISGINGITVTGTAVLVSATDQLGIAVSSRKYKDNIQDMGSSSDNIYKLRPTTFTYKESTETRFGLIAEEVAEVYPELVVYDQKGDPQTVMYHELPALLLNEIQKLKKEIELLKKGIV